MTYRTDYFILINKKICRIFHRYNAIRLMKLN